jgi:hypothetical protein
MIIMIIMIMMIMMIMMMIMHDDDDHDACMAVISCDSFELTTFRFDDSEKEERTEPP